MSAWQFDPCVKYRYRGDNELELYYGDLNIEHFQYSNGANLSSRGNHSDFECHLHTEQLN